MRSLRIPRWARRRRHASLPWIEEDAEGRPYEEWVYQRRNSWPMVYIYFDRDGKFSDSEYDY